MANRYFKIDTGRYGGETVCGEVTPEFYEYWVEQDQDELCSALFSDGEDHPDSPKPCADDEDYWTAWHEIDNFFHGNSPYADNQYRVCEITLKEGVTFDPEYGGFETDNDGYDFYDELTDWEDQEAHDYIAFASQELYGNRDNAGNEGSVPVLFFHSGEKGGFGEVVVVTDGDDFNPAKFRIDVAETDVGEFILSYWYDQKELPVNYDWCDTMGKSSNAYLTYLDVNDHEKWFKPMSEDTPELDEFWEADEDVM